MIARNKNIHSQSSSHLKKSHSKSMAIKIADSAIIDLVQPPLVVESPGGGGGGGVPKRKKEQSSYTLLAPQE